MKHKNCKTTKGTTMVMMVKTTDEYFYEKKHDLLILEMRIKEGDDSFWIDREACETAATIQREWFKTRGINSYHTVSPSLIIGWEGHYYIDVDPVAQASLLDEYSSVFETDGESKNPEQYQMLLMSYSEWLDNDGISRHEQHLKDLEDPDYCP